MCFPISGAVNKNMITHKFSGHLNSNLFIRAKDKTSVTQLWSSYIVPLIASNFSDAGLHSIKGDRSWDECLIELLSLGAVYKDQKRIFEDGFVDEKNLLRIHLMPRRYQTQHLHYDRDIIFEDENLIAVNKPALLPVHPTLDNAKENLLFLLQQKAKENITCLHRLDLETTGLILFSKNEAATRHFQNVFAQKKIKKIYKAVVEGSKLAPGHFKHWMKKSDRAPKIISDIASEDSSIVELKVLHLKPFSIPDRQLAEIQLLTGRTHQIRAQMSHLGFPLAGDRLYGGSPFPSGSNHSHFLLHSTEMEFVDSAGIRRHFILPPLW
jgi:23S rRNA pseudouridine1911/1915/1917 synthase